MVSVLEGQQLRPALLRLTHLDELDVTQAQAAWVELAGFLRDMGQRERPELLSSNRETQTEINALIERSGWQVSRRKAFVQRTLNDLPPSPPAFDLLSLAQVGREHFVEVLLESSAGDPFETSTPQSAQADFDALIEGAGQQYDPAWWFVAHFGGLDVGVILP